MYTEEDVEEALLLMGNGMSMRAASEAFNVPKSTLLDRVKGHHSSRQGRPTELTPEEEHMIVERLKVRV
jgi:transposase